MGWLDGILERLNKYAAGVDTPASDPYPPVREREVHTDSVFNNGVFDRALQFVMREEGGYVNDPHDPGGETKFGISKRANPSVDIKNLTREQAKQIYYTNYWVPVRAIAEIHPKLAIAVFDTAVNMGVKPAIKLLQSALDVPADGIIGPATRSKIESRRETIIPTYLWERLTKYQGLSTWKHYSKGWTLRVIRLAMEVA